MTNYVKSTNFATKDALASGNPLKIVKGAEIDTEFNNIATAIATKADLNSPSFVTPALGTPSSGVVTNLTGTASININGTVGATTPNTGSFTLLRTGSISTSTGGTIFINSDIVNQGSYTITSTTTFAAPVGTPSDSQKLIFRIYSSSAYGLTWNSIFRVIGVVLPTTTVANKTIYVGCIYNSNDTKWDVVAVTVQA